MKHVIVWNIADQKLTERAVDPLGFDALREAMSDVLVPFLTGATRRAEDYLWILVGLEWAERTAKTRLDVDIWSRFERFERALKLFWFKFTSHRQFSGLRIVERICRESRPDVSRAILTDQRGTGLMGNYIVSLRSIGLVESAQLRVSQDARYLLGEVQCEATPEVFRDWNELANEFRPIRFDRRMKVRLGERLFSNNDAMRRAASGCKRRARAKDWATLVGLLLPEQDHIARACRPILELESVVREAFAGLLKGQNTVPNEIRARLKHQAREVTRLRCFPDGFNSKLQSSLERAFQGLTHKGLPEKVILELHRSVTRARGNEAWIERLGDPAGINLPPNQTARDYRFRNLQHLVKETFWSPV